MVENLISEEDKLLTIRELQDQVGLGKTKITALENRIKQINKDYRQVIRVEINSLNAALRRSRANEILDLKISTTSAPNCYN